MDIYARIPRRKTNIVFIHYHMTIHYHVSIHWVIVNERAVLTSRDSTANQRIRTHLETNGGLLYSIHTTHAINQGALKH